LTTIALQEGPQTSIKKCTHQ